MTNHTAIENHISQKIFWNVENVLTYTAMPKKKKKTKPTNPKKTGFKKA